MGFISDISTEDKVSIAFYTMTSSIVDGIIQPELWVLSTTVDGLMWFGLQNIGIISDKLKTQVEGAVSIDYNTTIADLDDNSKFIVNGIDYKVLYIEDVGMQHEVLQILFKRDLS